MLFPQCLLFLGRHFLAQHRAAVNCLQAFSERLLRRHIRFGDDAAVDFAFVRDFEIARHDLALSDDFDDVEEGVKQF